MGAPDLAGWPSRNIKQDRRKRPRNGLDSPAGVGPVRPASNPHEHGAHTGHVTATRGDQEPIKYGPSNTRNWASQRGKKRPIAGLWRVPGDSAASALGSARTAGFVDSRPLYA